jgi:hypothetical protein
MSSHLRLVWQRDGYDVAAAEQQARRDALLRYQAEQNRRERLKQRVGSVALGITLGLILIVTTWALMGGR